MTKVARETDAWGRVTVRPEAAFEFLYQGGSVDELFVGDSPAIERHNEMCRRRNRSDKVITTPPVRTDDPRLEHAKRASEWFMPEDYLKIDVHSFLLERCQTQIERDRVDAEMAEFTKRDHIRLLQAMIFLVDSFRENKIVWGVGRGSSVASYCLYLIGIHKIDSLKYGLDFNQFLK